MQERPFQKETRHSPSQYHDILGLVDGLGIIAVVVLSVVNLDSVVSNVQKDLIICFNHQKRHSPLDRAIE